MADSRTWLDLEAQFHAVPNGNRLDAIHYDSDWHNPPTIIHGWHLYGDDDACVEFMRLARIGAALHGHAPADDETEWVSWLNELRKESRIRGGHEAPEVRIEGEQPPSCWKIPQVPAASAEYCSFIVTGIVKLPDGNSEPSASINRPEPMAPEGTWPEIKIVVIGEETVQVFRNGQPGEVRNYNELRFGDGRQKGKKPIAAWSILLQFGKGGSIDVSRLMGKDRMAFEKRIEEIRERLRLVFRIDGDPIPSKNGVYEPRFKISRSRSADI